MDIQLINKKVKQLYKKYGTVNPFDIAKEKGYIVLKKEMPDKLKGYTTTVNRITFIYINSIYDEVSQYYTCLHELGHIFCKHDSNIIFTSTRTFLVGSKYENEADSFATAMILHQHKDLDFSGLTLNQISCTTGITVKNLKLYFSCK